MFLKKKKEDLQMQKNQLKKTAQEWLPFYDVGGNFLYLKDEIVAVLQIEPMNIVLKSANEKKKIIRAIHESWNAQAEPLQILSLPRPVDLDQYLIDIQNKSRDSLDGRKKRLLQDYLNYVTTVVRGGEAMERRYYILLKLKQGKNAKEELNQRAYELCSNLERSGLKVSVCDDLQIHAMLFNFLQPAQAAFEPVPMVENVSTIYQD